jgi:hypothetical protein
VGLFVFGMVGNPTLSLRDKGGATWARCGSATKVGNRSERNREMSESAKEPKTTTLELKICERCGGLWLRPSASRWIYCGTCKQKISELPKATANVGRKRRGAIVGDRGVGGAGNVVVRTERVQ